MDTRLTGRCPTPTSPQSDSVAVDERSLLPTEAVDSRGDSISERERKRKGIREEKRIERERGKEDRI